MTYTEIHHLISALEKADKDVLAKIDVVESVYNNIDVSAYDEEAINELCDRVLIAWFNDGCDADFDDLTYSIQQLIDDGKYSLPNGKCIEEALALAHEYELSRGS